MRIGPFSIETTITNATAPTGFVIFLLTLFIKVCLSALHQESQSPVQLPMEKEEVEANRQVIVEEGLEAIKQAANCLAESLAFGQPLAGCRSIRLPPSDF